MVYILQDIIERRSNIDSIEERLTNILKVFQELKEIK